MLSGVVESQTSNLQKTRTTAKNNDVQGLCALVGGKWPFV
jgi:hypothetical protein